MTGLSFRTPGTFVIKTGSATDPDTFRGLDYAGRTLLVTDETLQRLGIAGDVQAALIEAGADVVIYDKVTPEPGISVVRDLVESTRNKGIDRVVGLGGGSPMDVSKLAALLLAYPQPIESMYGVNNAVGTRLPLTLIPTTAGTGSEATHVVVITRDDGQKSPILGPQFICDNVILDANLTVGLPPFVSAATGVDAMVHAIEAFTSGVRKNPASDQLALKAFELLYNNVKTVVLDGKNGEARSNMLTGSMLAGLAFANATVGAVHALAYPLGTQFHLCHGESNALMLPAVMRYNMPEAAVYYANLAGTVLPETAGLQTSDAANKLIDKLVELVPAVGLRHRLSDCGIGRPDLNKLVDGTLVQERLLSYNIKEMNRQDILDLFTSIL